MASSTSDFDYNTWRHTLSRRNLDHARRQAHEARGYDSTRTRRLMSDELAKRANGMRPRDWQLDVAEAFCLGLDCTVIAGTGAGKTIPFLLPSLLPENRKKVTAVLSPLKALQVDQTRRFRCAGVAAIAANSDTWSNAMSEGLKNAKYQALFTSPEMFLKNPASREVFSSVGLAGGICGLVVDEAHCISQWGGDFRPAYAELSKMRALVPPHTPVLCLSATMTPKDLDVVEESLLIDPKKAFYLNLGNDRPNIMYNVVEMKNSDDFEALDRILALERVGFPSEIPKTLIFANTRILTQRIWRHLRDRLDTHLHTSIDFLHSFRRKRARHNVMKRFTAGSVKILIATEAAGMGADIPDIERVIQFGAPNSLSVWVQRAGRAGRSVDMEATAILLIEKSAFQKVKTSKGRQRKKRRTTLADSGAAAGTGPSSEPRILYKKIIHPSLRAWLECESCRRVLFDKHFRNPARANTLLPRCRCCDRCAGPASQTMPSSSTTFPEGDSSDSDSDHDIPSIATILSARTLASGSRKRTLGTLHPSSLLMASNNAECTTAPSAAHAPSEQSNWPAIRTNELRTRAVAALEAWRMEIRASRYAHTPFSACGILSDKQVDILAYDARIKTISDLQARLHKHPWVFAPRHGQEVLDILQALDADYVRERQARKLTSRRTVDENRPPTPPLRHVEDPQPSTSRAVLSQPPKPRPVVKRADAQPIHPHSLEGRFSLNVDANVPFGWGGL